MGERDGGGGAGERTGDGEGEGRGGRNWGGGGFAAAAGVISLAAPSCFGKTSGSFLMDVEGSLGTSSFSALTWGALRIAGRLLVAAGRKGDVLEAFRE